MTLNAVDYVDVVKAVRGRKVMTTKMTLNAVDCRCSQGSEKEEGHDNNDDLECHIDYVDVVKAVRMRKVMTTTMTLNAIDYVDVVKAVRRRKVMTTTIALNAIDYVDVVKAVRRRKVMTTTMVLNTIDYIDVVKGILHPTGESIYCKIYPYCVGCPYLLCPLGSRYCLNQCIKLLQCMCTLALGAAIMEHIYQWHHGSSNSWTDKLSVCETSGTQWFHLPHMGHVFGGESCLQWCIVSRTIYPIRMQIIKD